MQRFIATISFFFFVCMVDAQTLMNLDSLLKLVPGSREDTSKVLLYINIGQQYESAKPELAKQYYREAGMISRKINYPAGIIKYISNYTYILNMQGQFDSSLLLNKESVATARRINDSLSIAKSLFNTGTSYRMLGDFQNAITCYEEGKLIFSRYGNQETEALAADILQLLYYELRQYDRAIEYGERAAQYLRKTDNLQSLAMTISNLAISYSKKLNFKKASMLFKEAHAIGLKIGNLNIQASSILNLGDLELQQSHYKNLKPYFDRAISLAQQIDAQETLAIADRGMAIYYFFQKDYNTAAKYGEAALAITAHLNLTVERRKCLETLSSIYYAMQDLHRGEEYLRQSTIIGDSLLNETVQKNTLDIEKKYEAEKKENQIKALQAQQKVQELSLERKNLWNKLLVAAAICLIVIALLLYRNYRQKQRLQERRITELETEKKLAATEAVLKGEEQERTRLAKDLHDGLGGMLSGIKYSFTTMKGNLIMTPENAQAFERSMDMLDSSIKEMRRVAHNMMPEALVKFGLNTALRDFCNDINQSGALTVKYQSIGMDNEVIEQTTAITIYRIVQELLNNIMKHSGAKNAIVQLSRTNGTLSLTVEDDGKGFDTAILQGTRGIGWSSIQTRVEYLKGSTDIQSSDGKGTSVHIEVSVQ